MKIIGGTLKGRNFFMPKGIRPTKDLLRKAIFDILGRDFEGLTFIDLYAGSGSVGFEALSHNAKFACFVERDIHYAEIINENISHLNISTYDSPNPQALVINGDVFPVIKELSRQGKKFNVAFFDPPFNLDLAKKTLKTLSAYDILHPACFILAQHSKRETLPETEGRFSLIRHKKYGSSFLTIYQGK